MYITGFPFTLPFIYKRSQLTGLRVRYARDQPVRIDITVLPSYMDSTGQRVRVHIELPVDVAAMSFFCRTAYCNAGTAGPQA